MGRNASWRALLRPTCSSGRKAGGLSALPEQVEGGDRAAWGDMAVKAKGVAVVEGQWERTGT